MKATKSTHTRKIILGMLAIALAALVVFAVLLVRDMLEERRGREFFANPPMYIEQVPRPQTPDLGLHMPPPPAIIPDDDYEEEYEEEYEPFVSHIDFDKMREYFPSIVGWIQSYGTNINYPIVHCFDNDFYLNHLPDGTPNRMGSIFVDFRTPGGAFEGLSTIVHGHDMRDGHKFGSLRELRDAQFFLRHPNMYIFTPYENLVFWIFAGYEIDARVEMPPLYFRDEQHFYTFIDDITARNVLMPSRIEPTYGDRIVFLATCITYRGRAYLRFIVAGKLVPE